MFANKPEGIRAAFLAKEDPDWWLRQVRKAHKAFAQDPDKWITQHGTSDAPVPLQVQPVSPTCAPQCQLDLPSRPFRCPHCQAAFPLRKHLGVHLARRHAILSPARHVAMGVYCYSCLRRYGSIRAVQQHRRVPEESGPSPAAS